VKNRQPRGARQKTEKSGTTTQASAASGTPSGTSLLIANARVLDPASGFDAKGFVAVRDGRIASLGKTRPKGTFDRTLDAKGLWLIPGIVDLAVRLREPDQTNNASIRSETRAAQSAGITSVVLPPDTRPVIDTPAMVDRINGIARDCGGLDIHLLGALTRNLEGTALAGMSALRDAGCIGLSNAYAVLRDALVARRALEYAHGLGLTVHVHAQDAALAAGGCAHEGPVATRLGLPPIPAMAEVVALRFWISLVEDTGAQVHFCRLSSARGADLVRTAQQRGLPVTADVAAHQLFLTEHDLEGFNAQCHVVPPLRSLEDRGALRAAVAEGVIGAICSDHQPLDADAKTNPFPLTEPGISALETLLPLTLRLVQEKVLEPLDAIARLSCGPAAIAGIGSGALTAGMPAHLVLVDPAQRWILDAGDMASAGRNTPFAGHRFQGRAAVTLWHGRIVFSRL
jgi:dihydroorotase